MPILPASSSSARGSSISLRLVSDFKGHQLGLAQALDAQAVHIAVPDPGGTDSSRRSGVGRSTGRLLDFGGETGRRLGCNPATIKRVDDLQVPRSTDDTDSTPTVSSEVSPSSYPQQGMWNGGERPIEPHMDSPSRPHRRERETPPSDPLDGHKRGGILSNPLEPPSRRMHIVDPNEPSWRVPTPPSEGDEYPDGWDRPPPEMGTAGYSPASPPRRSTPRQTAVQDWRSTAAKLRGQRVSPGVSITAMTMR